MGRRHILALITLLGGPAVAAPWDTPGAQIQGVAPRAPALAVASNFGQGARRDLIEAGQALGLRDFRDALYWAEVERGGRYVFTSPKARYPAQLARWGAGLSLTVNNGHPDYEDGATPTGDLAVTAFGRHAAETAARYPNIHSIEVGNEFNSANFVSGPLRDAGLAARAEGYAKLLEAVSSQAKALRPDLRIVGGGVHSVPTGYLRKLADLGAAAQMDALALHPYDTPPEILPRQIAVLRQQKAYAAMPLQITEFGSQAPTRAVAHLWKSYCQMALSGVERAAWYPLHPRGDGYVPLVDDQARVTDLGHAFLRLLPLQGQEVEPFRPDPFTFGCVIGGETLVIWGAPRRVRAVRLGIDVTGTGGGTQALSWDAPLIFRDPDLDPARDLVLFPHGVLADSFVQFGYPAQGEEQARGDGFERFARQRGQSLPLTTQDGQGREGVPWVPYRGLAQDPGVRLLSTQLLPSGGGDGAVEIVHRYTAPEAQSVDLALMLDPAARSADGVTLRVTVNGEDGLSETVTERSDFPLKGLPLAQGDVVEIAVGPGPTAKGDVTGYRFQILAARD